MTAAHEQEKGRGPMVAGSTASRLQAALETTVVAMRTLVVDE
jgi:hypothetical protein